MQTLEEIACQAVREFDIDYGERRAALRLVQRQLAKRFGPLEADVIGQLERLPTERLELLAGDLLDFTDRADLIAWLAEHGVPAQDDDNDADDAPTDTGGAGI